MRKYLITAGVIVIAFAAGCSTGNAPSRVNGKVTYKGEPVKAGQLTFYSPDGSPYSASLEKDGSYDAKDLPEGDFIVTVDTESVNPDRWKNAPAYGGGGGSGGGGQRPPGGGQKDGMKGKEGGGDAGDKIAGKTGNQKAAKEGEAQRDQRKQQDSGFNRASDEELRAKYVKIPAKYSEKEKTDLKATLKRGSNTYNFELKD